MNQVIPEAAVQAWEASAHPESIIGRLRDERKTMNQVIPEAAVEAAVVAYLKEYNYNAEDIVRLVLEAAAPHMRFADDLAVADEAERQLIRDIARVDAKTAESLGY